MDRRHLLLRADRRRGDVVGLRVAVVGTMTRGQGWLIWFTGLVAVFVLLTAAILTASFYCGTQESGPTYSPMR